MKKSTINTKIRLFLIVIATTFTSLAAANDSNKWRLEFSGNSETSGVIVFEITGEQPEPIIAEIQIPFDKSENDVAKKVETALDALLPDDLYHVERDDGEDVLVKKRMFTENFNIRLVSNSVKGVSINLDKE